MNEIQIDLDLQAVSQIQSYLEAYRCVAKARYIIFDLQGFLTKAERYLLSVFKKDRADSAFRVPSQGEILSAIAGYDSAVATLKKQWDLLSKDDRIGLNRPCDLVDGWC